MRETEPGNFVRWDQPVEIDRQNKILRLIPEARPEDLVEIPNEDIPSLEILDKRCSSY